MISLLGLNIHNTLQWLEDNVRKNKYIEGTVLDTYIATPAKNLYLDYKKQS